MRPDLSAQHNQAARLETLLQVISEFSDPDARATTEELIGTVVDMYGQGLTRILELTAQTNDCGQDLINTLARDDLVGPLLSLHGLHPLPLEERITRILNDLQPFMTKQGGKVELVRVEQGMAYLRLGSAGQSCSSTLHSLKTKLEETLYRAMPDLEALHVEEVVATRPQHVKFVPRRARQGMSEEKPSGPVTHHLTRTG